MKAHQLAARIKIEAKRHTELWIYSFADMYMIISVFFIALTVLYAAKVSKMKVPPPRMTQVPSAGRGPSALTSSLALYFPAGTEELSAETLESLELMLPVLKSSSGRIEVEGYSDSRKSQEAVGQSALALSSRRAVRVAEWMIKNGVPSSKIQTVAFGDAKIFPIDQEFNKSNRRVVIKVSPREASL